MAHYVSIYIELPVYLLKYIHGVCGQDYLTVKRTDELGTYILANLRPRPGVGFENQNKPGPNKLHLRISDRLTREVSNGKFLSDAAALNIKRKILSMFEDDLRHFVRKKHLDIGVDQVKLLRSFFQKYRIDEDDFKEGSMYRNYTRWKATKKIS